MYRCCFAVLIVLALTTSAAAQAHSFRLPVEPVASDAGHYGFENVVYRLDLEPSPASGPHTTQVDFQAYYTHQNAQLVASVICYSSGSDNIHYFWSFGADKLLRASARMWRRHDRCTLIFAGSIPDYPTGGSIGVRFRMDSSEGEISVQRTR